MDRIDGQPCKQPPGVMVPLIDRNRCGGKSACEGCGTCVEACPESAIRSVSGGMWT
jgi:ferredoxin